MLEPVEELEVEPVALLQVLTAANEGECLDRLASDHVQGSGV